MAEKDAAVAGDAPKVGVQKTAQRVAQPGRVVALLGGELRERHQLGRAGVKAQASPVAHGEAVGRACAVLLARLLHGLADGPPGLAVELELVEHALDVEMGMPDVELALLRKVGHRATILLGAGAHGVLAVLLGEAPVAPADLDARHEAHDVPLPGPGRGLVKVVDVKDEVARVAHEDAEVADVRVADALDLDAGDGHGGEVGGHDDGAAAVERERRDAHALVAQRHEARVARDGLLLYEVDRRLAGRARLPGAERLDRAGLASCEPGGPALLDGGRGTVEHRLRAWRCVLLDLFELVHAGPFV